MKTQHIKFEILKDRLSLFYWNLIKLSLVLNIVLSGQICQDNFHSFCDVSDDITRKLDVCHREACGSIVSILLRFDR